MNNKSATLTPSGIEILESRILFAEQALAFQQGVDGYFGTRDTYVAENDANASFGSSTQNNVEAQAGHTTQSLIRFDQIFGSGPGQIPAGAIITSATLTVYTGNSAGDDSSTSSSLYRMLAGWSDNSSWNSLSGGISADGIEASSIPDGTRTPNSLKAPVTFDVTATVQAWANDPGKNFGWALIGNGSNLWRWSSSEKSDVSRRPILNLTYTDGGGNPVNQAPVVSAGPDSSITLPGIATLDGTITDDGLPVGPAQITSHWSQVSGPGTATFADDSATDTTASFSQAGTYVLRLTADDGELAASDDVVVTVADASSTQDLDPLQSATNTGEKPQSKVWKFNGTWWGVFATNSGTFVHRLDGTHWTSVLKLSNSSSVHADVLSTGSVAHVLLYTGSSSNLASIEYVGGGAGSYQMWSSRPSLSTVKLSKGVETATLAIDGAGRMWVASDASTTAEVRYSDYPYNTFSNPITIGTNLTNDDITAIATLPNGSVGVLWSGQANKRFGFRAHAPGANPNTWTADEVPASQSALNVGTGMADDHLNIAVASDGTLYAAVKTSYDSDSSSTSNGLPLMALLVRRPNGTWDNLRTVDTTGTRGIIVLNEQDQSLMVVYSFTGGNGSGDIVYRKASLSNLSFGPRTTIMRGSLNNVSSTKQNVDGDVVFVAANLSDAVHGIRLAWPGSSSSSSSGFLATTFSQTSIASQLGSEDSDAGGGLLDGVRML